MADPAPVIYTIQTNPKMSDHYSIDSIVCLADAKHIEQHLDEVKPDGNVNEALQQVAFSDRVRRPLFLHPSGSPLSRAPSSLTESFVSFASS